MSEQRPSSEDRFIELVLGERDYQRMRWGDHHDDQHTGAEWALMVLRYAGKLGEAIEASGNVELAAARVAAVCCALNESIYRRRQLAPLPQEATDGA